MVLVVSQWKVVWRLVLISGEEVGLSAPHYSVPLSESYQFDIIKEVMSSLFLLRWLE